MKLKSAKYIALTGMFFALAIALSFFESIIAGLFTLPPGVKIGLSNIVVIYALLSIGKMQAFVLIALKAIFAALTRGFVAGALSFAGGVLSFILMILLVKLAINKQYYIFCVSCAIAHNLGQLLFLNFILKINYSLYYAPILLVFGIIMGSVTSMSLKILIPVLNKINK